jgi:hypothetical protein
VAQWRTTRAPAKPLTRPRLYGKVLPRDAFIQLQGVLESPSDSAFEDELVVRAAHARHGRPTHRSVGRGRR